MNIKLIAGIIIKPQETFDVIIDNHYFPAGMTIWLIDSILHVFIFGLLIYGIDKVFTNLYFFVDVFIYPKHILKLFYIFIFVYFQNLIATKYFKYESKYVCLLSCSLFVLIVDMLGKLFIILAIYLDLKILINYSNLIFVPWVSLLLIYAFGKVYKTSLKRSIGSFLTSTFFMIVLSSLLNKITLLIEG